MRGGVLSLSATSRRLDVKAGRKVDHPRRLKSGPLRARRGVRRVHRVAEPGARRSGERGRPARGPRTGGRPAALRPSQASGGINARRPAPRVDRIPPIWPAAVRNEALGDVVRLSERAPRPIGQAISATLAGGGWPRSLSLSRYESPFRFIKGTQAHIA